MRASVAYPLEFTITSAWVILSLNRLRLALLSHKPPKWAIRVAHACQPGWIDNLLTLDSSLLVLLQASPVGAGHDHNVGFVYALSGLFSVFFLVSICTLCEIQVT